MADRVKLTPREKDALVELVRTCGARAIFEHEAISRGIATEFHICKNANLIQSAGYECSVRADDWLESSAGRARLAKEKGE